MGRSAFLPAMDRSGPHAASVSLRLAALGLGLLGYANLWLLARTPAGQRFTDIDTATAWGLVGLALVLLPVGASLARDALAYVRAARALPPVT